MLPETQFTRVGADAGQELLGAGQKIAQCLVVDRTRGYSFADCLFTQVRLARFLSLAIEESQRDMSNLVKSIVLFAAIRIDWKSYSNVSITLRLRIRRKFRPTIVFNLGHQEFPYSQQAGAR